MTSTALSIPLLEQIKSRFSGIDLKNFKKILIASSVHPSAIVATSIICRAVLRKKLLFHVKFYDCISTFDQFEEHSKTTPDTLVLLVGLNLLGKEPTKMKQIVLIGSRFHPNESTLLEQDNEHPIAADSLAFAEELLEIGDEEWGLAAISVALEGSKDETNSEIIKVCRENGVISSRKGFKIPGFNFIPMNEVFANNIHPFLDSLSGDSDPSLKAFDQADIAFSKWGMPLSELTKEEARRLNGVLLLSLSQKAIPFVLGSDYEYLLEPDASPFRFFSSIASFARVVWSRHEMGLFLGILIGDRARLLNNLEKTYREHCIDTISAVSEMKVQLQENPTQDTFLLIEKPELKELFLPDAGRIILDSEIAEGKLFMVITTSSSTTVVWRKGLSLLSVLDMLRQKGILCDSTSLRSIRLVDVSEETRSKVIVIMKELTQ